ncbi:MAG: transglycosylase family protein [Actinobacteria bacterium]|nr:transglycosylase family protein [Actinomycetota bacterium]
MTPTKIVRRRRLRQAAGFAGAGVVAATAAVVAVPALAQSDGSTAPPAVEAPATSLVAESTPASAAVENTAEQAALLKLQSATPEERQAFIQMFWTPEQRFAFMFYVATPEQREAFVKMFQTPAPIPAPRVSAPKSAPASSAKTAAHPTATRGGGSGGGFLNCVRNRESRGQYSAVNGSSGAAGAYQFMPQTARNTALRAGRPDLAGRPVTSWSSADQDAMAAQLYSWQGSAPWGGGC